MRLILLVSGTTGEKYNTSNPADPHELRKLFPPCFMAAQHRLFLASVNTEVLVSALCVIKQSAHSIWASCRARWPQWHRTGTCSHTGGHVTPCRNVCFAGGMAIRARGPQCPVFLPLTKLHTGWSKTYGLAPLWHWCAISASPIPYNPVPPTKANYFKLQLQNF